MMPYIWPMRLSLFDADGGKEALAPGATVLRGFARKRDIALLAAIEDVAARAPFRHMVTPGGFEMSVAMTNCGIVGWLSDRKGYRYEPRHPGTGKPWPPIPQSVLQVALDCARDAGFDKAARNRKRGVEGAIFGLWVGVVKHRFQGFGRPCGIG